MEKIKNPQNKVNAERPFDWDQRDFGGGTYLDPPASEIPDNSVVRADNCKVFPKWIEGRSGTKKWGTATLPVLSGRNNYEATKSGTTITKTAGNDFTAEDVDNYFIWPDGTHEQITGFISSTQVSVESGTSHSPATASDPASIRGPVNGWIFHQSKRLIVLHIDTRFFYSTAALPSWTEIYKKCYESPISDVSVMKIFSDFVFVFNSNGIFKIDLNLSIPEFWKANAAVPENTIIESAESSQSPYGRRYLIAMSRISGNGDRDRTTSNSVIKQESGTPAPDPSNNNQDYREVFNPFPFGSATGSYQKLDCGSTSRTFTEWTSFTLPPGFTITLGGSLHNFSLTTDQMNRVNAATSWDDIALVLQERIQANWPTATATCEWDTDHFVFTNGKTSGKTIGYITDFIVAWATNIGDNTYLNGQDPSAGGNGSISTIEIASVVGPLTPPANEQQWTHYSIYGTKDSGDTYGILNDRNQYVWIDDIPVMKAFSAARDVLGNIVASNGTFEVSDVGSTIRWADGSTDTIATYVNSSTVTGTAGAAITAQGAAIGAIRIVTASQSGTVITRTSGTVFVSSDVGKTFYWADGYSVYIKEFISGTQVRVAENQNHSSQGGCWDPTTRHFNDAVSDEVIENRIYNYLLRQRFWTELPVVNTGGIAPGFMFCAVRGQSTIYYSQMSLGLEYLAGYFNPAFQYELLDDALESFEHFPDQCILFCASSTKRISVNVSKQETVPGTNAVVTLITGVTTVDPEIGCLDFGSIRNIEEGRQILVTSEPGVRMFDGYGYGPNIALDSAGNGRMLDSLRTLQSALASSYDPIEGYIIWGTDRPL